MFELGTYDPADIQAIVGGARISGFADGEFISANRETNSWESIAGADGFVTRVKQNDRRGLITLTLQQTSPSNNILSGFYINDEATGRTIIPVLIKDIRGTSIWASGFGWIIKPPDSSFGKEVSNRAWAIACSNLSVFVGGNVVVG